MVEAFVLIRVVRSIQSTETKSSTGEPSSSRRGSTAKGISVASILLDPPIDFHSAPPQPGTTRVWHDRTGQFRVEAAFLGFSNGKLRLHKINGVVVEVPSSKMSVEDMRYVEKMTTKTPASPPGKGPSDDDVPLAVLKNDAPRGSSSRSPAPK